MKGNRVLDSSALLAYFQGEKGCLHVKEILKEAAEKGADLFLSVVNWGEILYVTEHKYGEAKRSDIESLMSQMHLNLVDADQELTREAAHLKTKTKLPYADCFAAALALIKKAELVTADHDFRVVEDKIRILWVE